MADKSQSNDQVFAKCARRLIPFIFLLYMLNYIDRVNVGFAALTMNADVGLSPAVFGFGAGIFFFGYMMFQVPANLVLERIGARRWVFIMLVVWGLISAGNALISDPFSYYALRFFLGVAEAGFFPGMLYYMTFWFPQAWRGRFIAGFMAAIPMAQVVGAPLSTFILEMDGVWGLQGWQWMFIIEGLPTSLMAFAALKFLPDGPAKATWLTDEEKTIIAKRLASEDRSEHRDFWPAFKDARVYALGLVLLGNQVSLYGIQLWLPQIVQGMGYTNRETGIVISLIFLAAMVSMILSARSSDKRNERIWHVAIPLFAAAAGLVLASLAQSPQIMLAGLSVALIGTLSYNGAFFSLPATFLAGTAAAGGIGLVNTIGSLGRFVGPTTVGVLREQSGDYSSGMAAMAGAIATAAIIVLFLGRVMATRTAAHDAKLGGRA